MIIYHILPFLFHFLLFVWLKEKESVILQKTGMRNLFTILLLTAVALSVGAQERRTLRERADLLQTRVDSVRKVIRSRADSVRTIHLMDSLLDARDQRARLKYDTLYIAKPSERWTVKLRTNVTGNHLLVRGKSDGQTLRSDLDAAHKLTFSVAVGYRGLTLAFAANPLKWAGKYKDLEYNIISYGRKFGFDMSYAQANTFGGTTTVGDKSTDIERGNVAQKLFTASGYYVFNHRKFSYPAAFSQSQLQLRSAGSFLLGASLNAGKITSNVDTHGFPSPEIRFANFGVGGGYGYNLVLGRILLHASGTSNLVVGTWSRMKLNDGSKVKTPWRFPNFMVQGRVAALYNWKKSFAGFTAISNFSSMGDKDQLDILQLKWIVRMFYGFRF